ncbi:MAG TPA: acetate/propionate family kinase [Puia sp.]|nr:acetate/propionate family kinase [Puia sp.]
MNQLNILTINGGSSSIKFSLYTAGDTLQKQLIGAISKIGLQGPMLTVTDVRTGQRESMSVRTNTIKEAADFLITWLEENAEISRVEGVGHRIVHGMIHSHAAVIDEHLLEDLHQFHMIDPDHLPGEIALIEAFRERHPQIPQVACFDTAFHAGLPRVARLLTLPRRFDEAGVRRYGFHGISCTYLMEKLIPIAGYPAIKGRIILAHLGNGASLTAVRDGKSIDTSMGFTPAGGVIMGTRAGDLDPGVVWYMMRKERLSPDQFNDLVNHQSGLLGVSAISSDMQDLLNIESSDVRAAEAIALFCYQVKKWIGAFTAVLDGLDILVFSGGIGENAASIRSRICTGLDYLGIELEEGENGKNSVCVSSDSSRVQVYVIPTDEESIIAKNVYDLLPGQT